MITHPPFPNYIFNIIFVNIVPGTSYIRPSVLLSKGSALSLWFLSNSSCAWYTYVPVLSVFILKLVVVMVLKFSLPRLHRKNMTSNHTFCCRSTGYSGLGPHCNTSVSDLLVQFGGVNFSQSLPFHIHSHCMEYFIGPFEKRIVYNVNFQFTREMFT